MATKSKLLSQDDIQRILHGEALEQDYFYIPVFCFGEPEYRFDRRWWSLHFNENRPPDSRMAYRSKVPAGATLWQAVRSDLEQDFHYPHDKSFIMEFIRDYDTAPNKQGDILTRVLAQVEVDEKFKTEGLEPVGLHPHWADEGTDDMGSPIFIPWSPKS